MRISRLIISYTRKCTLSCAHCCIGAGPRETAVFPGRKFLPLMDRFHGLGIRHAVVTGGEATLCLDTAGMVLGKAAAMGWEAVIVTNAWWAVNGPNSRVMAARLRDCGTTHALISTGRYHQEYIPVAAVRRAVEHLKRRGIRPQVTYLIDRLSGDTDRRNVRMLQRLCPVNASPLLPEGRARVLPESILSYDTTWNEIAAFRCPASDALLIDHRGRTFGCYYAPDYPGDTLFSFGNVFTEPPGRLEKGLEAARRVRSLLAAEGPAGVYRKLSRRLAAGFRRSGLYSSPCEFCAELFTDPGCAAAIKREMCT